MGRLLLDLKKVDQRTIDKYQKEADTIGKSSFALAWVMDQGGEERARGVTIDISMSQFETDNTSFTILDAPGHQDFISNMIAGASQADFAVLVIDASTNSFESGLRGQTKEHALLLRSAGVMRIIVAINKMDTTGWSKDRFDEIKQQVTGFLATTGFLMKNVSFVPVSGLQGDNILRRSTNADAAWYTGMTLVEELDRSEPLPRALDKPLRISVAEIHRTTQSPLIVSGRVEAGSLQTGDAVIVEPSGEKAYIKLIEKDANIADWAVAGQQVSLHLSHIDPVHVHTGDVLCDPANTARCVDNFIMKALAFDSLLLSNVNIHRGRLHEDGHIKELTAVLNKQTGVIIRKKPKAVQPGTVARIVVQLRSKAPLEAGQRVVLRSDGKTVAAGLIEQGSLARP